VPDHLSFAMAFSVHKMLLITTLLLAVACLASGFAPGPSGAFLARAGGSATCSAVQLRRSFSAPALRSARLTLMAKKKGGDEVPEEAGEASEEPVEEAAEAEVVEVVEVRPLSNPSFFICIASLSRCGGISERAWV